MRCSVTGVEHAPFVEVRDDGVGLSPGDGGRGLMNMRRRAERLGGTLTIGPRGDGPGVEVRLLLPGDPITIAMG
jgi:signal transduction histidine kinase